jgi:hypothetical protein
MYKQIHNLANSRRVFARNLLSLGIGATLLRYTGAKPVSAAAAATEVDPPLTTAQGYRLTPHIERYYRSARSGVASTRG